MIDDHTVSCLDRSHLVPSHARAYLLSSLLGSLFLGFPFLGLLEFGAEDRKGCLPIVVLAFALFAADGDTRWYVLEDNGSVGLVAMLPSWSTSTSEGFFKVTLPNVDFRLMGLLQHGNGHRGSVHSTTFFRGRHTLPTMTACFTFE